MLEPPLMVIAFRSAVRICVVEALILVVSARLVFRYWDAFTPPTVTRGPSPWRQELGGALLAV